MNLRIKNIKTIDESFCQYKADIITNCPMGGDGGHGGVTYVIIKGSDDMSGQLEFNIRNTKTRETFAQVNNEGGEDIKLIIKAQGDFENIALIELFEKITLSLKELSAGEHIDNRSLYLRYMEGSYDLNEVNKNE